MIRLATVQSPLDEETLADPAVALLRRAVALGLLDEDELITHLDVELLRRIAKQASAAGIGQDASFAILRGPSRPDRLGPLIARLNEALQESPAPDREAPELLRVFSREDLAALMGTSAVSLGRYLAGSRVWPDDLAARIHWLALVISDLSGAYNAFGIRRWFGRERTQLGGRSPRQAIGANWDPADPEVERVRELAASLAGVGTAT